jgi:hypothetical protein
MPPWVRPVAAAIRRCTDLVPTSGIPPATTSSTSGSRTTTPARTSRATNCSALSKPGMSHSSPRSRKVPAVACGLPTSESTRRAGGRCGIEVPCAKTMPNDSEPSGTSASEAVVSGPRTAAWVRPLCCQNTSSQCGTAIEVIRATPDARLRHTRCT